MSRARIFGAIFGGIACAALAACELVYGLDGYEHGSAGGADAGVDGTMDAARDAYIDASTDAPDVSDALTEDTIPGPTVLAPAAAGRDLAGDQTSLYWLSAPGDYGSLMRTDKADGGTTVIVADAGANPSGIALDGTRVYWTTRPIDAGSGSGSVLSALKDGQGVTVLASATDWRPTTVAVDSDSVYIENPWPTTEPLVSRVKKDGGARITVVSGAGTMTLAEREGIAVDDEWVYYQHASQIFRLPKACPDASPCLPTQVMIENPSCCDVDTFTTDDAAVYWTMRYNSAPALHGCGLWSVPKGGDAEVVLIPLCGSGAAVDDTSAYMFSSAVLFTAPKTGGGAAADATGAQATPNPPIVTDDLAVYWLDLGSSSLMKLAR